MNAQEKNQAAILETLEGMGIQTNAALNTTNAADSVPQATLRAEIMDLVPSESFLMPLLPGDQNEALGRNLDQTEEVTIVGEIPEFQGGEGEQTSGFTAHAAANGSLPVGKVTISQKRFELTFDITSKLQTYSNVKFLEWLKKEAPKAMAKTLDTVILNGDNATAANTNINLIDGTPAATANYLKVGGDGIRKRGLADGIDVGAITFQDYLDMLGAMGVYGSDASQLLWLFNNETYVKSLGLDEFKDAAKNGKGSIIHDGSKAVTNILGADVLNLRSYKKSNATGKISATAGNNTKGGASLLWLPGIQHGFGETFQMRVFDFGSRGVKLNMWFDWGFAIADPSDVGIDDGKTVITAYNATV